MKSKKSLYILLPAVIIVWGFIIYKIVDYFNPDDESIYQSSFSSPTTEYASTEDTIEMIWNYRDPFLDEAFHQEIDIDFGNSSYSETNEITISDYKPEQNAQSEVKWPDIKYKGIIFNKENGNRVCLFNINNHDILLNINDSANGVLLMKASKEEAVLSFNNEKKTFKK